MTVQTSRQSHHIHTVTFCITYPGDAVYQTITKIGWYDKIIQMTVHMAHLMNVKQQQVANYP